MKFTVEFENALKKYQCAHTALREAEKALNNAKVDLIQASGLKRGMKVLYRGREYLIYEFYLPNWSSDFRLNLTEAKKDGSLPMKRIKGHSLVLLSEIEVIND